MRIRVSLAISGFVLGVFVSVVTKFGLFFNTTSTSVALIGLAIAVGSATYLSTVMEQDPILVRELVKQIAIWFGVVVLLPLSVWYGTSAFSPPPDSKMYTKSESHIEEQIRDTTDKAAKEQLRRQRDALQEEREEKERVFYHDMFWVAYPLGLLALVVGTFVPVQCVGSGLMFGGLISLSTGCYSFWDRMDGWLRFSSLIVALLVVVALGVWRFRSPARRVEDRPA